MKKTTINPCAVCLMAAIMLISCGGKNGNTSLPGEISDFEVEETFKSVSRSYRCEGDINDYDNVKTLYTTAAASIQWPETFGNVDISAIQDSIISMAFGTKSHDIDKAMNEYVEHPEGYDIYKLTPVDALPTASDSVMIYSQATAVSIVSLTETMTVIKGETTSYTGGAHDSYASRYLTFALSSGKARVIGLSDLFEAGSEAKLLNAIKSSLMAKYNVDTVKELDNVGVFSENLFVTDNIYIDGYNIVFHYNPYEIGPWAMGVIDVEVPYYTVAELLTPMGQDIFM